MFGGSGGVWAPGSRERPPLLEAVLSAFPPNSAHLSSIFLNLLLHQVCSPRPPTPAIWKRETHVLRAAELTDVDILNAKGKGSALREFGPSTRGRAGLGTRSFCLWPLVVLEKERLA